MAPAIVAENDGRFVEVARDQEVAKERAAGGDEGLRLAGRAAVEDEVDGERVGEGRIVVAQAERGEGEAKREGGEEAGEERAAVHGEGEGGKRSAAVGQPPIRRRSEPPIGADLLGGGGRENGWASPDRRSAKN